MVEELRAAAERVHRQPEEEQRHIARLIVTELEDQAREQSSELANAVAEAHAEFAAGDAVDYEEYARGRRQRRS